MGWHRLAMEQACGLYIHSSWTLHLPTHWAKRTSNPFILGNDEAARKIYNFCGSKSGRDYDKVKETGLQAIETAHGAITYEQARLTIEGRKMFRSAFKPEDFLDKEALTRWYNDQPGGSLHTMYIVEIEKYM